MLKIIILFSKKISNKIPKIFEKNAGSSLIILQKFYQKKEISKDIINLLFEL